MLDLSITNKSFMTVKMPDKEVIDEEKKISIIVEGDILYILPPKRKLTAKLMNCQNISDEDFDTVFEIIAEILSNNRMGKTFTLEDTNALTLTDAIKLITAYIDFISQLQQLPN